MTQNRFSTEALMEIFHTPAPSQKAIHNWRESWRYTHGSIEVKSYLDAVRFLNKSDIDPLFYQFFSSDGFILGESKLDEDRLGRFHSIVFFYPEHEVLFKLHNGSF